MEDYEKMVEKLRSKGQRLTPQRLEIIKAIAKYEDKHPSLSDLMNDVKKVLPTVSFSTLYNTVMKFEEIGLVHLFSINGETRIETKIKPHINLIDRKSGKIEDIDDTKLLELIKKKIKSNDIIVNIIVY
ncbi:MAG TPA: transcriptional repressor [Thermoplasmatales archaeon]|nr:transcriptional repressor [Thermoplasmatales archaeon]